MHLYIRLDSQETCPGYDHNGFALCSSDRRSEFREQGVLNAARGGDIQMSTKYICERTRALRVGGVFELNLRPRKPLSHPCLACAQRRSRRSLRLPWHLPSKPTRTPTLVHVFPRRHSTAQQRWKASGSN